METHVSLVWIAWAICFVMWGFAEMDNRIYTIPTFQTWIPNIIFYKWSILRDVNFEWSNTSDEIFRVTIPIIDLTGRNVLSSEMNETFEDETTLKR
ncbi:hypothetical protein Glove_212g166 [Diversispora epigaea]|uniref:Uncharacterized protein n=1 Tax=Diversispora epigaea TaxID=1348612 RepID=A0A397IIC4_9GLOM|nr:hypothetical protein Glove_212g166 [Diversispora epigaea]